MCGRFVSSTPPDELGRYFGVDTVAETLLEPNYNVAPTSDVYAVLEDGGVRRLDALHWGLVPIWAKDLAVGNRMINARAETLAEKNAFKRAYRKRRCIIPADGFYEWKKRPGHKAKQPMFIHRADGEPFAFAGLWEVWHGGPSGPSERGMGGPSGPSERGMGGPSGPSGGGEGPERQGDVVVPSCTIVTGKPNEKVAEVHDRMPVMLPPSAWDTWLDPENDDLDLLGKLLVPAPTNLIAMHPVSTEVNNVRNRGPQLMEPAEPLDAETR